MHQQHQQYTLIEEAIHAATHGAGVILSIAGLTWMLYLSIGSADPWRIVASVVYGSTMIALFLSSTVYHAMHASPRTRAYKMIDHCAIYLLIAGTYTPFALVSLRGALGWTMFVAIWAAALHGIWRAWRRRDDRPQPALPYAVMGWMGLLAVVPLIEVLGPGGMLWLVLGGLLYTVGIVFYRNDERWRHAHGIWHLFVLGGSASHFAAVLFFV